MVADDLTEEDLIRIHRITNQQCIAKLQRTVIHQVGRPETVSLRPARRSHCEMTCRPMIQFKHGDILQADAEALVNTVNCVGIMGRRIALQFRKEFPEGFEAYKAVCDRRELHPGMMLVFKLNQFQSPRYIINSRPSDIGRATAGSKISGPASNRWRKKSASGVLRPLPYPRSVAAWVASVGIKSGR